MLTEYDLDYTRLGICFSPLPPLSVSPTHSSIISLQCYLAGAQHSRHAVAVSEGELDLDVDSPGSLSGDPARPQPIVLAGTHHITDLIHRHIVIDKNKD